MHHMKERAAIVVSSTSSLLAPRRPLASPLVGGVKRAKHGCEPARLNGSRLAQLAPTCAHFVDLISNQSLRSSRLSHSALVSRHRHRIRCDSQSLWISPSPAPGYITCTKRMVDDIASDTGLLPLPLDRSSRSRVDEHTHQQDTHQIVSNVFTTS